MIVKITGLISLICLVALLLKFPVRKTGSERLNKIFWRLHMPCSGILFIMAFAHMGFALKLLITLGVLDAGGGLLGFCILLKLFTGIGLIAVSIILIALCHIQKEPMRKMFFHRMLSIILLALIVSHMIFGMQF